jgi:hypothetical protein
MNRPSPGTCTSASVTPGSINRQLRIADCMRCTLPVVAKVKSDGPPVTVICFVLALLLLFPDSASSAVVYTHSA